MTVAEYTHKFEELCRFSRIGQGNPTKFEEWKCIKFEGGLRDDLLAFVGPMEIRTFPELVNKSQLVEGCSKKLEAAQENRREVVHKNFNKSLAPRGINFKANGQQHHQNQQGVITWDKSKENNLSKIRTTSYAQSVGRIMVEDAVNLG
ncbi:hypothetical protein PIB30_075052 [Stylosanthes scabra]|uniref:Retrotransposon gag domain-containing protein n=1 Tax=Stylosanthes scabra TaxID=79078 RepID=A0ABU6VRP8_9FABA|nr:hypothetical protein [Stylosanthes scabra]